MLKSQFGYVFTNEPVFELKPRIENFTVPAAAKVGLLAQCDVVIPPGPTVIFFNILKLINKGNGSISNWFFPCSLNHNQNRQRINRNLKRISMLC